MVRADAQPHGEEQHADSPVQPEVHRGNSQKAGERSRRRKILYLETPRFVFGLLCFRIVVFALVGRLLCADWVQAAGFF